MKKHTETEIRKLQASTIEFWDRLGDYIDARRRLDPKLKNFDREDFDDATIDWHGDDIAFEWQEYDSCGDADYFRLEFPLSDLWDVNWEARLEKEQQEAQLAKEREEAKRKAEAQYAAEQRERAELARLQEKYSV